MPPARSRKQGKWGDGRHWFLFPRFISLAHSTEVGSLQGPRGSELLVGGHVIEVGGTGSLLSPGQGMPAVDAVMTGSQGVPAGFVCELDTGETKQRRPSCQKLAARFLEDPVSWMKEQKAQQGRQGEVEAKVQALDKLRLKNHDCSNA